MRKACSRWAWLWVYHGLALCGGLDAEDLHTEVLQLSQHRAVVSQGFSQLGEGGPEVGVRRQRRHQLVLDLGQLLRKDSLAHKNRQKQRQAHAQLHQAHPLLRRESALIASVPLGGTAACPVCAVGCAGMLHPHSPF